MGFSNDDGGNELLDQQIQQTQAEMEQKRLALFQEKLGILHGQGAQSFTPNRGSPLYKPRGTSQQRANKAQARGMFGR